MKISHEWNEVVFIMYLVWTLTRFEHINIELAKYEIFNFSETNTNNKIRAEISIYSWLNAIIILGSQLDIRVSVVPIFTPEVLKYVKWFRHGSPNVIRNTEFKFNDRKHTSICKYRSKCGKRYLPTLSN